VVQTAEHAYRLKVDLLENEIERNGLTMRLPLRYTQALITQMAQTAVCIRHHSVDQQLCRWLLLSLDRLSSNELSMTQELIANMLGVRREGVTEAAGKLQDAALIRYRRARIALPIARVWTRGPASAARWSRRSSIVSCPTSLRSSPNHFPFARQSAALSTDVRQRTDRGNGLAVFWHRNLRAGCLSVCLDELTSVCAVPHRLSPAMPADFYLRKY
jgi:hypothetical protein